MKKYCLYLILFIFTNTVLFSQNEDNVTIKQPRTKTKQTLFKTTITISPIHLAMPVVELMGEFALSPKVSVAVVGGLGTYEGFSVSEFGGQLNLYATGNFDKGMQVGLEILYASVSGSIENVSGVGNGLSIGPFIGYKGAFDFGLSIDIQLGVAFMTVQAEASGSTASAKATAPLLNLNVGWSF